MGSRPVEYDGTSAGACAGSRRRSHYFMIVTFDSYDEAMKNWTDPTTQEFSAKLNGTDRWRAHVR
jgi:hypothetical protein